MIWDKIRENFPWNYDKKTKVDDFPHDLYGNDSRKEENQFTDTFEPYSMEDPLPYEENSCQRPPKKDLRRAGPFFGSNSPGNMDSDFDDIGDMMKDIVQIGEMMYRMFQDVSTGFSSDFIESEPEEKIASPRDQMLKQSPDNPLTEGPRKSIAKPYADKPERKMEPFTGLPLMGSLFGNLMVDVFSSMDELPSSGRFYQESIIIERRSDGTVEKKRHYKDHNGRDETTITVIHDD